MNEKKIENAEQKTEAETKAERPRLTVEVPTEISAGKPKNCVSCYCSRAYCCS
jgi:hypothetical protein